MKLEKYFLLLAILIPTLASAAPINGTDTNYPVGLWDTVHYKKDAKKPVPVRIKVCIQADGTWSSLNSQDGMGGKWTRLGTDVHLSGNGKGLGGTGDVMLITPYKMMAGTWQSWPLNNPTGQVVYSSKWLLAVPNSCTPL